VGIVSVVVRDKTNSHKERQDGNHDRQRSMNEGFRRGSDQQHRDADGEAMIKKMMAMLSC
jgi:hypothetical protein